MFESPNLVKSCALETLLVAALCLKACAALHDEKEASFRCTTGTQGLYQNSTL